MKILLVLLWVCVSLSAVTPMATADEPDSIDALRKEVRALKQRIAQLEQQIKQLSRADWKPPVAIIKIDQGKNRWPAGEPNSIPSRPASAHNVDEVLRLQIESPGSLLKDIHERERLLRHRRFFPEVLGR